MYINILIILYFLCYFNDLTPSSSQKTWWLEWVKANRPIPE